MFHSPNTKLFKVSLDQPFDIVLFEKSGSLKKCGMKLGFLKSWVFDKNY